ncbi:hypothetical protein B296_00054728 [Ensete ventricosum]|uniref:Uncharacterized protein n=1 Tax=Ensete ventricosum TaxID=4639 RepID=A0A426XGU1_ENSVE|nr:hypothetical protein B296_00054728 [Ensete ventricosum]
MAAIPYGHPAGITLQVIVPTSDCHLCGLVVADRAHGRPPTVCCLYRRLPTGCYPCGLAVDKRRPLQAGCGRELPLRLGHERASLLAGWPQAIALAGSLGRLRQPPPCRWSAAHIRGLAMASHPCRWSSYGQLSPFLAAFAIKTQ